MNIRAPEVSGVPIDGYLYNDPLPTEAHGYLHPALLRALGRHHCDSAQSIFDLGCGNGSTMAFLERHGYRTSGVDPSIEGIAHAAQSFPELQITQGSAYEDLGSRFGQFQTVYSLEVVEHVYAPRLFAQTLANLLKPGGTAIVSTPYHGYLKNLALAASGQMDRHFTALWDHGHIKFWSVATLSRLMAEVGLVHVDTQRVGRIPVVAKSMVVVFHKPDRSAVSSASVAS